MKEEGAWRGGREGGKREVENAQKEASGSPNIRAAHPQSAVV